MGPAMKPISHRQRSWKRLFRCGAATACLSIILTGYAQTSGPARGSSTSSNDRTDRDTSSTDANANRSSAKLAKADQKFVREITEASQREVAIAQLGVERATNPEVKAFAQKMVTDHLTFEREFVRLTGGINPSASATALRGSVNSRGTSTGTSSGPTGGLAGSAGSSGASSATDTMASAEYSRDHSAMNRSGSQDRVVHKLKDEKSGQEFDRAFVKAMLREQKEAADLLDDTAKDNEHSEQVRSFANRSLPTIRAHLAEAKRLEKSLD